MTIEGDVYNSAGYIFRFDSTTPHYLLKARLSSQECTMTKNKKFYQLFGQRYWPNLSFMSWCRFCFYDGDPAALGQVSVLVIFVEVDGETSSGEHP